jgi:hypothetical protein
VSIRQWPNLQHFISQTSDYRTKHSGTSLNFEGPDYEARPGYQLTFVISAASTPTPVPRQCLTYQFSATCVYIAPNQLLGKMTVLIVVYHHYSNKWCNNNRQTKSRQDVPFVPGRVQSNQCIPVANLGTNDQS